MTYRRAFQIALVIAGLRVALFVGLYAASWILQSERLGMMLWLFFAFEVYWWDGAAVVGGMTTLAGNLLIVLTAFADTFLIVLVFCLLIRAITGGKSDAV